MKQLINGQNFIIGDNEDETLYLDGWMLVKIKKNIKDDLYEVHDAQDKSVKQFQSITKAMSYGRKINNVKINKVKTLEKLTGKSCGWVKPMIQ